MSLLQQFILHHGLERNIAVGVPIYYMYTNEHISPTYSSISPLFSPTFCPHMALNVIGIKNMIIEFESSTLLQTSSENIV